MNNKVYNNNNNKIKNNMNQTLKLNRKTWEARINYSLRK